MPEVESIERPKTAGFVDRGYNHERKRQRIEEGEEEIRKLEAVQKGDVEESTEEVEDNKELEAESKEENLSAEEKSFKKRYGDLRRHMSEKEKEWQEKLESSEKKSVRTNLIPPKSDEDIEAWARKYPDVAGIVETIAAKKAKEIRVKK